MFYHRTIEEILQQGIASTGAEAGSIWLLREGREGREIISPVAVLGPNAAGMAGLWLKAGEGIVGRVIAENVEILLEDVIQDPAWAVYFDNFSGFNTRSVLCVPLVQGATPIGALQLLNKESGPFSFEDMELARALAGEAVSAIEMSGLME